MNSLPTIYAFVAFFCLALAPMTAQAKGLFIINTGDEIFDVADLPEDLKAPEVEGWRLGWMCSRFGILWADVWTWDCKLIAYDGDTFSDLPADIQVELEAAHPKSNAKRGVWNRFGIFAMLGVLGVLGVVGSMKDDDDVPSAADDGSSDGGTSGDDPPPMPK